MRYVKGNLLDAPEKFIMHGCNSRGAMGAGVAKYVREKWPHAYQEYHDHCEAQNFEVLRHNIYSDVGDGQILINAVTQDLLGAGTKQARYTAVVSCIEEAIKDFGALGGEIVIAMPKIGCGLGGCKWEIMEELLLEVEEFYNAEFVVYEL